MGDLPVKHFLDIYETRLGLIENSASQQPALVSGIRNVVAVLRTFDANEGIHLDSTMPLVFIRTKTGERITLVVDE
jgi:hypothetical protein